MSSIQPINRVYQSNKILSEEQEKYRAKDISSTIILLRPFIEKNELILISIRRNKAMSLLELITTESRQS